MMIAPSPVRDQGNPSIKASSCGRLKLIRCNSSVHTVGASVGEKISRVRVGVAKDLDDSGQGGVGISPAPSRTSGISNSLDMVCTIVCVHTILRDRRLQFKAGSSDAYRRSCATALFGLKT